MDPVLATRLFRWSNLRIPPRPRSLSRFVGSFYYENRVFYYENKGFYYENRVFYYENWVFPMKIRVFAMKITIMNPIFQTLFY
jgi:hypothetical protein